MRLWDDPEFLAGCAPALTADERAALHRPAPSSVKRVRWTAMDYVLLDELNALLEGAPTYVHVVVDEAQDLSPMQCRAVARRCPLGSITVLGDLAQATTPWAPGDWSVSLTHLGHGDAVVRPLTAGYRVPGEVIDLANRLLPHVAVGVPPGSAVRAGAGALRFGSATALADEVARLLQFEGSIGVIAPDATVSTVLATLADVDAALIDDERDARVTVVPASAAKGLEFDSVLLLEPAAVVAAEPTRPAGLRRLYVVLTRAVSHLTVLHDDPLPPELAA
jgi:DNA helicase IV